MVDCVKKGVRKV